jgi:hypothetical protein
VVGPRRFTAYYLVSVLAAPLTQLVVMALAQQIYPTVGASGGVFGCCSAYAIYFPNNRVYFLLVPFPIKARVFVFIYAAIELSWASRARRKVSRTSRTWAVSSAARSCSPYCARRLWARARRSADPDSARHTRSSRVNGICSAVDRHAPD